MLDYSYVGTGRTYMRERGVTGAWVEVGNVSALALGVTEEKKSILNYMQPGGGAYNELSRISSVELTASLAELSPANIARAMYGTTTETAGAGAVNTALGAAYQDSFLPVPGVFDAAVAPVISAVNGDAAVTRANSTAYALGVYYVPAISNGFYYKVTTAGTTAGTPPTFPVTVGGTVADGTATVTMMGRIVLDDEDDYAIRSGGVYILPDAFVTDTETFQIDYTTETVDVVQALVNSGKEFEVIFTGVNEARSPGKGHTVRMHRVRINAASSLGFIGDDYQQLEITGTLLPDTAIVAAGLSQYFTVTMEQ